MEVAFPSPHAVAGSASRATRAAARPQGAPRAGRAPHLTLAALREQPADGLAEVGAEVGLGVGGIAVGGDAVEDPAGDRPAAAGGAAGDVALHRQVERPGPEEGGEVVALVGGLGAELQGGAVEGRRDGVAVDVEDLVGGEAPGDAFGAGGGGELLAAFVGGDDGGADIEVLIAVGEPLPGGAEPFGDEDAEGALAVVVAGDEDPLVAVPAALRPALVDAVAGGEDDAEVGRVDRRPRAAGEAFAVAEREEDRPVLTVAGKGRVGDRLKGRAGLGRGRRGRPRQPTPAGRRDRERPRPLHASRRPKAKCPAHLGGRGGNRAGGSGLGASNSHSKRDRYREQ